MKEGYKKTDQDWIPEEWEDLTFGDIVKFSGGAQPPRSTFVFEPKEGYIRLIQTRDYKSDKYKTYIPEELARKRCSSDDIMIGRYGPPIFQILRGLEGAYNVALLKAVPNKSKLYNEYLYYYISQYDVWAFVENLSQRSGGQTGVDLDQLKKYPFPLPSLPEQQKIADILSTVDEKIGIIDEQIAQTGELKKGLMQRLLTKGIGHTRFKELPLGRIPENWEVMKLNEFVTKVGSGITPKGGSEAYVVEGISFIRSQNVLSGMLNLSDVAFITEEQHNKMSNSKVLASDVLLNITGASIGRACVVPETIVEANVNQHVCIIRTTNKLDSSFLCQLLNSSHGQNQINRFQAGGNREGLNYQQIRSFDIPTPPVEEQQQIAEILTTLDEKHQVLQDKKQQYNELKKALMQQLLTGKLRVKLEVMA